MSARRRSGRYTPPKRILCLLPDIPDDAPVALKNALAVRNEASRTGRCPACGSLRYPIPEGLKPGSVTVVEFRHDDGCPALLEGLL